MDTIKEFKQFGTATFKLFINHLVPYNGNNLLRTCGIKELICFRLGHKL